MITSLVWVNINGLDVLLTYLNNYMKNTKRYFWIGMIGANANSINAQCTCKSLGRKREDGYISWARNSLSCIWVMGPGCLGNLLLQALASGMISKGVFGKVE